MPAADLAAVACTLGPADMAPRLARVRRLTRDHLRSHHSEGHALRLRYDSAAGPELERIVALERVCCAFLGFTLAMRADAAELTIEAPAQPGADARWLFSQFLPDDGAPWRAAPQCSCCTG
jgi:hypothetical protein